jgi:hypothetical protein
MNTRARPLQVRIEDDVIVGYHTIADTMPAFAEDAPTAAMDSVILSAARENSRRRRARPVGYAAIAAGIVAVGLAISTSRDPGAPQMARPDDWANLDRVSAARGGSEGRELQRRPRVETRNRNIGLNSLVLSAFPTEGANLQAASETHTAAGIQAAGAAIDVATQFGTINLNQPDALERLARENSFQFALIRRILAGIDTVPEHAVGRWMKSQFNATDVTYSSVLLTSDPPQKQLTFTLETTRYSAVLTLTPEGARLVPPRP